MSTTSLSLASLLSGALLVACGGNSNNGPCEGSSPDPICNQECGPDDPCPTGFFCQSDGTCHADCQAGGGTGCGEQEYCDINGECQPRVDADCPNVTLTGERTTPTVQLLIDQSGSMTEDFGSTDRWNGMKQALIDGATGVVTQSQGSVIFGASLYTGTSGTCPRLTSVPRALNNLDAIADLLDDNGPASETPTGEAIEAVIADFAANPVPADSVPIILLATDGEPDTCAQPNPQNGQPEAVAAAEAAYAAGIRLYILSVGNDVSAGHMQDMADAGAGGSGTYFVANNPQELTDQLMALVSGVLSCELNLDGSINGTDSCLSGGEVIVNGEEVPCTGWEIVDNDTIRLVGEACDAILQSSDPTVSASFPCGVVVE